MQTRKSISGSEENKLPKLPRPAINEESAAKGKKKPKIEESKTIIIEEINLD